MLTPRQNLLETIRGGNPDRFVKQYEAFSIHFGDPTTEPFPRPKVGETTVNGWGVTYSFPENVPAAFPLHDDEHVVLKDASRWREFVKGPALDYPDEAWAKYAEEMNAVDRNEYFATIMLPGGIFEQLHSLMGMENCLISFYTEPEAMHELIDYIVEFCKDRNYDAFKAS